MRVRRFALAVALNLLVLLGLPAHAQESTLPASSSSATFAERSSISANRDSWLETETFVLRNGMTVHFVHRPFSKFVAAGWAVRAGAADDVAGKTGLAHLVEHLLFQGTQTIGTKDWEREEELLEAEESLGQVASSSGPRNSASRELEGVRRNLAQVQRRGELARLWADGGVLGTGALTTKDFSFYTGTFPKERLEGWMWLERDRILRPAMRGIEREQAVVQEEALQRVAGVSRGEAEVAFDRFYWGESPYARPTDGDPGEMEATLRSDALAFHELHYVPAKLVAVFVGDVELQHLKTLAERYFGGLGEQSAEISAGSPAAEPPGFGATPRGSEYQQRCECRPTVRIRYPSLPYSHSDAVALDVLAALLNGRSGRLNLNVVAQQQVAFASYATHKAQARAGAFTLVAEAADQSADTETLRGLRAKLEAELSGLFGGLSGQTTQSSKTTQSTQPSQPLREAELQRAKNILLAQVAREIKASDALRTRLLIDDSMGDGSRLEQWPQRLDSVNEAQLRRLVSGFLKDGGVTFYLESSSHSGSGSK